MESVLKPTAKQVAHEAGVSIAAVSRAFSPGSSIDPLKRQRILQVAAQLGYSSPARRTAEVISAGTVTLVAGDLANPFYPLVLDTLAKALQAVGRQLLVYAIPPQADMDQLTPQILAARPSALVVTSASLTSGMANACRQHGIRVVLLDLSSVPVMDSKPSRVPLPASRPIRTIGASLSQSSFQLVISPV